VDEQWSDLRRDLNEFGNGPLHARLSDAIRTRILDGRLTVDARLPAERVLAAGLGVSRNTVVAALNTLRASGFVESRRGAGSRVRLPSMLGPPCVPWQRRVSPAGRRADEIDFAVAAPSHAAPALAEAITAVMGRLPEALAGHGYASAGLDQLRAAIADRYTAGGLPTSAGQILVTIGAQQGLDLIFRLVRPTRAVVDSPTYANALDSLRNARARLAAVAHDGTGWNLGEYQAALRTTHARLIYAIPDFHLPTGALMPAEQREHLVALAARFDAILVIDEAYRDVLIDGDLPPHTAGFGDDERVLTVGSLSKAVWGGLRVGWVRGSRRLIDRLVALRAVNDLSGPVWDQLVSAYLVPRLDDITAGQRPSWRSRRDALLMSVSKELPFRHVIEPAGGLSAWFELPTPHATEFVAQAADLGVHIASSDRMVAGGVCRRYVRLTYPFAEADLRRGVSMLATAWARLEDRTSPVRDTPVV
jgi:DNA-binding transcriptional MocR family regulator